MHTSSFLRNSHVFYSLPTQLACTFFSWFSEHHQFIPSSTSLAILQHGREILTDFVMQISQPHGVTLSNNIILLAEPFFLQGPSLFPGLVPHNNKKKPQYEAVPLKSFSKAPFPFNTKYQTHKLVTIFSNCIQIILPNAPVISSLGRDIRVLKTVSSCLLEHYPKP